MVIRRTFSITSASGLHESQQPMFSLWSSPLSCRLNLRSASSPDRKLASGAWASTHLGPAEVSSYHLDNVRTLWQRWRSSGKYRSPDNQYKSEKRKRKFNADPIYDTDLHCRAKMQMPDISDTTVRYRLWSRIGRRRVTHLSFRLKMALILLCLSLSQPFPALLGSQYPSCPCPCPQPLPGRHQDEVDSTTNVF